MDIIQAFTVIWTAIATWLQTTMPVVLGFFWTAGADGGGELTFMGVMAVIMAGVALVLLLFNLIRSFFPMRG